MALQEDINNIHSRNKRVELDKAWEISKTRKIIIALLTYLVISIFLIMINISHPWLNALIPVIGFILSTLTLDFFKKKWVKHYHE
ncbi:MAG: hypothetical protein A3D39_00150 [Candidatus Buchananbacteria bacterium RIFCSPHIGHO2_02_FULL_39_17]|uniref:2TM domain-containing protein n=1 Tax=Candidatus Buchananbacteria bacterium RIFCSPLOWO2_01_FULL_40_23b TaxID=1797544 RepID=A0A1G1YTY8_9BACT|nr:MAG: hypothetical protein A3D39_00150 [Candidatus Buchananbacteria bacterium RIFCSPHIGHO2_02_FULL_39_17]OGY55814.1 MAG: hypothetical protein A2912_01060 [Candidatus Buchananbacteria bacterium RIFCSPLOWO2_01_FULL_40_23b]